MRFRKKYKAPSAIIMVTTVPAMIPLMIPPDKEVVGEYKLLSMYIVSLFCLLEVEVGFEILVPVPAVEEEEVG